MTDAAPYLGIARSLCGRFWLERPGDERLGLAIAQRAVEAHGGTIRAANIPGGGLAVEISLPSFTQR